jgi:hypothetical protein
LKYLAATFLVAALASSCGDSPTAPSAVNVQGTWGRGSAAQGTFSLTSCAASGTFDTAPAGLRWCDLAVVGQTGQLGFSLLQAGSGLTGTLFLDGSARALTGAVNGTTVLLSASWMQYPGDANPIAAALIRTFRLNGSASGQMMTGDFTLQDTFREGSGFTGALTLGFRLMNVSRE